MRSNCVFSAITLKALSNSGSLGNRAALVQDNSFGGSPVTFVVDALAVVLDVLLNKLSALTDALWLMKYTNENIKTNAMQTTVVSNSCFITRVYQMPSILAVSIWLFLGNPPEGENKNPVLSISPP